MDFLIMIAIMIAVGAVIGGLTNALAIKMLFRPYTAKYIGKYRIPFTPGLIPKRREEMAIQLGKMVVEHLVTAHSLRRKLTDRDFQADLVSQISREVDTFLRSETTVQQFLEKIGVPHFGEKAEGKLKAVVQAKIDEYLTEMQGRRLDEILPAAVQTEIAVRLPEFSHFVADKLKAYFQSEEGQERLSRMVNDFLGSRGMLGGMLQMFLGQVSLADKLLPELIKFLEQPGTRQMLTELLVGEWVKLKAIPVEEALEKLDTEKIKEWLVEKGVGAVPIGKMLNQPILELLLPYEATIKGELLPAVVSLVANLLAERMESILSRLQLADLVSKEVESFSVQRLEELVLGITSRELSAITWLGALLGGIIGALQAILVWFLG